MILVSVLKFRLDHYAKNFGPVAYSNSVLTTGSARVIDVSVVRRLMKPPFDGSTQTNVNTVIIYCSVSLPLFVFSI